MQHPTFTTGSVTAGIDFPAPGQPQTRTLDPTALMDIQKISLAQARTQIATASGLNATPSVTRSSVAGASVVFAGSTPMSVTAETALTVRPKVTTGSQTKRLSTLSLSFGMAKDAKPTSIPDPVANLMAVSGETRAQAMKELGGDPLAQYGAMLSNGTRVKPTAVMPADVHGALIDNGCADAINGGDPGFYSHSCDQSYIVVSPTTAHPTMWEVAETFLSSFSVHSALRYPKYADVWMAHWPWPGTYIIDWSPASDQSSGNGCGSGSIGVSAIIGSQLTWPICDGYIGPNGPRSDFNPRPSDPDWLAGPLFGPLWGGNILLVQHDKRYENHGVSLIRTDGGYGGRTFRANLQWLDFF